MRAGSVEKNALSGDIARRLLNQTGHRDLVRSPSHLFELPNYVPAGRIWIRFAGASNVQSDASNPA
jgi:hypothetical protein